VEWFWFCEGQANTDECLKQYIDKVGGKATQMKLSPGDIAVVHGSQMMKIIPDSENLAAWDNEPACLVAMTATEDNSNQGKIRVP
jgi:hypothetical protein